MEFDSTGGNAAKRGRHSAETAAERVEMTRDRRAASATATVPLSTASSPAAHPTGQSSGSPRTAEAQRKPGQPGQLPATPGAGESHVQFGQGNLGVQNSDFMVILPCKTIKILLAF